VFVTTTRRRLEVADTGQDERGRSLKSAGFMMPTGCRGRAAVAVSRERLRCQAYRSRLWAHYFQPDKLLVEGYPATTRLLPTLGRACMY
jgi:hypothetical protein